KEITFFRDNPVEMLGLDLYWLRSDHSRAMARQAMKIALAGNEQVQENVVMYAREGWGLADATLKEIIAEGHNSNLPLPPVIAEYIVDLTKSPARKIRGKGKADNFLRDIVIVTIVERVRDK